MMIEALIFRTYKKDLNNLALQERRLRNQLKEDTAKLERLQQERIAKQQAERKEQAAKMKATPTVPQNGFEFSPPVFKPAATPITTPETPNPLETDVQLDVKAA